MASTASRPPAPATVARAVERWPVAAATAVLQVCLVLVGATVAVALVGLVGSSPRRLEVVYAVAFGLALPGGWLAGRRLAVRAARASSAHVVLLAGSAAAGLLAAVGVARVVDAAGGHASPALLAGSLAWAAGMAVLALRPGPRPPVRAARAAVAVACLLLPAVVAAFLPPRLLDPGPLAASLVGALALTAVLARPAARLSGRWLGWAFDAAVLALAVLWIVDVASYLPNLPYDPYAVFRHGADFTGDDQSYVMMIHHNFWLAPVNDVLHGRAVLVDTYSQYGYGVIYFLAAFFKLAPLGHGGLALLIGALTGLQFAAGYAVLRLAGCARALAAAAVAAGIVAVGFGTIFSIADMPSVGGLRYGLAYALLLVAVAAAGWPRHRRPLQVVQLGLLALASVWSLETFGFVAVTYAAVTAVEAAARPGSWTARLRAWGADLLRGALVSGAAVALFVALTWVLAGSRPHVRPYLAFVQAYTASDVGTTLGIPRVAPWATGFAVAALYLASAVGVAQLVGGGRPRPELRPWLVAVAGVTAFGAISFSYWVTRPDPRALPPLALPAIMLGALWLERARRLPARDVGWAARGARLAMLAMGAWLAALAVVFAWPATERKWRRAAAWHAVPGGPSLSENVRTLWRSPPVDRRAVEGARLLRRHFPGDGPVLLLLEPALGVETLIAADRVNRLPLGDLIQDDLIRNYTLHRLAPAVERIPPGSPMLVQLHPDPRVDVIQRPNRLHEETLALIRRRFDLVPLTSTPSGLTVVRLTPRSP